MHRNKENNESRTLRILENMKKLSAVKSESQNTTQLEQIHKPQIKKASITRRSQTHQVSSGIAKKYGEHRRCSRNEDQQSISSSSSSSESRYIKLKTALQAQTPLRKHNEFKRENFRVPSSSSLSSRASESDQYWNRYQKVHDKNNQVLDDVPIANVLHLKNPIINQENESLYYENRGRFPDIDWSTLNGVKNPEEIEPHAQKHASFQKLNSLPKSRELSKSGSELQFEMENIIENSTSQNTIYQVRGNIKKTYPENSPLLKLQKMLKKESRYDKIKVVQEIRQKTKTKSDLYVINKIDSLCEIPVPVSNKKYKSEKLLQTEKERRKNSQIKNSQKVFPDISQNIVEFDSKDTLSTLSSGSGQRKHFEELNDDMFDFLKPGVSTARLVEDSYDTISSHMNSKTHLCNENTSQSSQPMKQRKLITNKNKPITQQKIDTDDGIFEFERPKNLLSSKCNQTKKSYDHERSILDSTLDSDDTSVVRSCDFDNVSVTVQPAISAKFLSLRKRLMGASTMKKDIEETCVYGKSDSLLKETYTRYFKDLEKNVTSNKTSESVETSLHSSKEEEVLLKPVSVRYFTQSTESHNSSMEQKHEKVDGTSEDCSVNNESQGPTKIGQNPCNILENSKSDTSVNIRENCDAINKISCEVKNDSSENTSINEDDNCHIFYKHHNSDRCSNQEDSDEVEQTSLTESIVSVKAANLESINQTGESSDDSSKIDHISTIFYKHKGINDSSITIEEVNTESNETKSSNLDNSSKIEENSCNVVCGYSKDDEDLFSDEEFDVVNFEEYGPFKNLISKFKHLQAVQKAHATGEYTDKDLIAAGLNSEINNNNKNLELVAPSNLSNRSLKIDENIFKDVDLNVNQLSRMNPNSQSNNQKKIESNYDNITEPVDQNMDNKNKGPSKRMRKMKNGLVNLQKHLEKENHEEESNRVPSSSMEARILRTNENTRCNQSHILQQITKMNLHMNCKPFSSNR